MCLQAMDLLSSLRLSPEGEAWLHVLDTPCIQALDEIQRHLAPLWATGQCVPGTIAAMRPFRCIRPEAVRVAMLCKEPYAKKDIRGEDMATGVPIEVPSDFETPSIKAFRALARRLWGDEARGKDFMQCFYRHGVLVINAAFTVENPADKRYCVAASHHPLWCRFTYPLLRVLRAHKVAILAVGIEAKRTTRAVSGYSEVTSVTFPVDGESSTEFLDTSAKVLKAALSRDAMGQ